MTLGRGDLSGASTVGSFSLFRGQFVARLAYESSFGFGSYHCCSAFWWLLIPEVGIAMLISLVVLTFVLWLAAHVVTFFMGPQQYFWELKKGIDPFLDGTLPWPINPDPDWVNFV